jgi:hypothetical protein
MGKLPPDELMPIWYSIMTKNARKKLIITRQCHPPPTAETVERGLDIMNISTVLKRIEECNMVSHGYADSDIRPLGSQTIGL